MTTPTAAEIAAQNFYGEQDQQLEDNSKTHRWRSEFQTRYIDGFETSAFCANECGAVVYTRVQSAGEARMGNAAARQPCPGPKQKEYAGRG